MTTSPQDPDPLNPPRYASYARVSTAAQAEKQISVPAQQAECRGAVLSAGGLLVREFADAGVSGETLDRPQLQAMLAWAREGAQPSAGATVQRGSVARNAYIDYIIVWKLDRLSRPNKQDDLDYLLLRRDFRAAGVEFVSATEPWVNGAGQMDRFMSYLSRGQSTVEALQRLERFRLGKKGVIDREGRSVNSPPYAYTYLDLPAESAADRRRGRAWTVLEPQARVVRMIFSRFLGGASVRAIVRELNEAGEPAPAESGSGPLRVPEHRRTRGWTPDGVGKILANRTYSGWLRHGGEWIDVRGRPRAHAPIIDDETWQQAQAVRSQRGARRAAVGEGLFGGGILHCPRCAAEGRETHMVTAYWYHNITLPSGGKQRVRYRIYKCQRGLRDTRAANLGADLLMETCRGWQITETKIAALLTAKLRNWASSANADRQARVQRLRAARPAAENVDVRADVERQLAQIPRLRQNYSDQQALDLISMDALKTRLVQLSEREEILRAKLAEMEEVTAPERLPASVAAELLRILEDDRESPLCRRDALASVVRCIVPGLDRRSLTLHLRS